MRLSRVVIRDFRRIHEADIQLEPATFVIGQNNHGKSSIIRAVELLLSLVDPETRDFRIGSDGTICQEMQITGYFTGIDAQTTQARGFKGRVVEGTYCYRKTFKLSSPTRPVIECLECPYTIQQRFAQAERGQDLIDMGVPAGVFNDTSIGKDLTKKLKSGWERELLDYVVDFDLGTDPNWVLNPGGIPSNVASKLPVIMHVPSLTQEAEIGQTDKKTLIADVLQILFEDLIEGNETAVALTTHLTELEQQMSPQNETSLMHQLIADINDIISSVFPGCGINIRPSLQDLKAVLRPKYDVSLHSNVDTDIAHQGTGLLRTAVFSMLRYHAHLRQQRDAQTRSLLVAFEEPELYLHPSAANLLRETIYALGATEQVICTTHSPWMVDLSQDLQSLVKMVPLDDGSVSAINYGVSTALQGLGEQDRARVKMIQVFDDEVSRVFFANNVVVVEGDSEVVAIKRTFALLPEETRRRLLASTQVVKARGKAAIVSLVKYLKALAIDPVVIHDRDEGVPGAAVFNEPISLAVGEDSKVIALQECLEDVLGYAVPAADKPYHVYQFVSQWQSIEDMPEAWSAAFRAAFALDGMN